MQTAYKFACEFEVGALRVDIVKALPHKEGLTVVLENTGEVLHTIPRTGTAYPTEPQQLMMISRIGTWLASQKKPV